MVFVGGGTGSGKSTYIKRRIANEKSVLVWDAKDEYSDLRGFHRISDPRQLAATLSKHKHGRWAYVGPLSHFDFWANAVWSWGNCVAIAEELADVTSPGKASGKWGECIRKGRGFGIRIIGASQRPAEVDKTLIGNATEIVCGRLSRGADRKYMANELDLPLADLNELQKLHFIHRCMDTGAISREKITF